MKIWKISHGRDYFDDNTLDLMKSENRVSVHPETPAKGQSSVAQGDHFLEAEQFDLFYVCISNEKIDFLGIFLDNRPFYSLVPDHDDWTDRQYILICDAVNPENYDKNFDKWWSPRDFSTFIEIFNKSYEEFEIQILKPVFNILLKDVKVLRNQKIKEYSFTLNKIVDLQKYFHNLFTNKDFLFSEINQFNEFELKKLEYEYDLRGDHVEKQPVVLIRKKIIQHLLINKSINSQTISEFKNEIGSKFKKNVFLVWVEPFRILYPLFFAKYKDELENYMNRFIDLVRINLNIYEITNKTLNHFDGAQNQGSDQIWFAIYNNTYSSQKHAYQLFFQIKENGFNYGLLSQDDPSRNQLVVKSYINWKELISEFTKHLNIIKNDNSKTKAMIFNYIDLLHFKKQIILQGPPGSGKTYIAKDIAEMMIYKDISIDKQIQKERFKKSNRVQLIQFHPSYSYEDFVRGITAKSNGQSIEYKTENKVFGDFAKEAYENYINNPDGADEYILIIDEINRANLPSVLGELIYSLEYRGEDIKSMYILDDGTREINVPPNLFIIGTMNTADRSIGHIDYAIRRRFAFVNMLPKLSIVTEIKNEKAVELFNKVASLFYKEYKEDSLDPKSSGCLAPDFKPNEVMIGHSYFLADDDNELKLKLEYEIVPILQEYIKDGILIENDELSSIMKQLYV